MRFSVSIFLLFFSFSSILFAQNIKSPEADQLSELPKTQAAYTTESINLDGKLDEAAWKTTPSVLVEKTIDKGQIIPEIATTVRTLWTDHDLYISFAAPYRQLRTFEPPITHGKRVRLWEGDVVEVFINSNPDVDLNCYSEYQVAPTGEKLDLLLRLPEKDFLWDSHFEAAVHLDNEKKTWTTEIRIPFSALGKEKPKPGTFWRINYYRHAIAEKAFLGWSQTLVHNAHVPDRFGFLEFTKQPDK